MAVSLAGETSAYQARRSDDNRSLLRATLDPKLEITAPPNLFHDTNFSKAVTGVGNFVIGDDVFPAGSESVSSQTGMILYLPLRGVGSIARFGFVAAGVTSPINTLPLGNITLSALITDSFLGIVYNAPLAIPYLGTASSAEQIVISPELDLDFSKTRTYAGRFSVKSTTLSAGTIALNGYMAAGSISDTRDICQNGPVGGTTRAYSIGDLNQQSVTKKDGLQEVSVMDGITCLVGPDIPGEFTPPNTDSVDMLKGEYATFAITDTQVASFVTGFPTGQYNPLFSIWASPWFTTANVDATWLVSHQNLYLGAINEYGCVDYEIEGRYQFNTSSKVSAAVMAGDFKLEAVVQHYWAVVHPATGALQYVTGSDNITLAVRSDGDPDSSLPPTRAMEFKAFKASFTPKMRIDKYTGRIDGFSRLNGGKYIGSFIAVCAVGSHEGAAIVGHTWNFTLEPNTTYLRARARNVDQIGEVGPARVIRWDNVSKDQNMRVDCLFNVQCIPQGTIAPFVQVAAMTNPESTDLNAIPWIASLYNGPGIFRRVWTTPEYEEMLRQLDELTSVDGLLKQARANGKEGAAGQSAGIFGSLGSQLGSTFGPIGGLIGGIGGSLADSLIGGAAGQFGGSQARRAYGPSNTVTRGPPLIAGGAAGQFGYQGGAAGKYGASAGQFGDAAGQFGDGSGRMSGMSAGSRRIRGSY